MKIIVSSLLFFSSTILLAQSQNHYAFWNKVALSYALNQKNRFEIEIQNRWQNNIFAHDKIWFEDPLTTSYRLWYYYQIQNNICFIFSPYSYFENSAVITTESSIFKPKNYENRYSILVEYKKEVLNNTYILNKIGVEYRDFRNTAPDYFRFREKLSLKYDLNRKFSLLFYNEFFLNGIQTNGIRIFDQNRTGLSCVFNVQKKLKFEIGYMSTIRSQKNTTKNLSENNLILNTYYSIPNKKTK